MQRKRWPYLIYLLLGISWVLATTMPIQIFQGAGPLLTYSSGPWSLKPPTEQGEIILSDVKYHVDIAVDSLGVPHIFGGQQDDVAFGLGYMHARDRYFQMELLTRMVEGRLTELVGEAAIGADEYWLSWEANTRATAAMEALKKNDPQQYSYLRSYGDGVRHYLASEAPEHALPEYRMMGKAPRAWKDHYIFLVVDYMSWMLSFQDVHVQRQLSVDQIPSDLYAAFYSLPDQFNYIYPDTVFSAYANDSTTLEFTPWDSIGTDQVLSPEEKLLRSTVGSNNWAVAPYKTTTGNAVLCNDTHLNISLPNPWYQAHLHCPEFHANGFSLPATPFIVSGHNESMAWGMTNGYWNTVDRYLLKTDAEHPDQYFYENEWRNFETKTFDIHFPDGSVQPFEQQYCALGKVIEDAGQHYAQRWHCTTKDYKALTSFAGLIKGKDWNDFTGALSHFDGPPQNFVFADVNGNVGLYTAGKLPMKPKSFAGGLLDGTKADNTQYVPFEALPHHYNPTRGFVASANQLQAETDYFLVSELVEHYRAQRIVEVLSDSNKISIQQLQQLQMDRADNGHRVVMQLLEKYQGASSVVSDVYERLRNWDGQMLANSGPAAVYHLLQETLYSNFVEEFTASFPGCDVPIKSNTWRYLMHQEQLEFGQQLMSEDLVATSCTQAMAKLATDFENSSPYYGYYAGFHMQHPLKLPGWGAKLENVGGNSNSPNVNGHGVHGASMRTVINMGPTIETWTILPGGQSERVNSSNYRDQALPWRDGIYVKSQFVTSPLDLTNIQLRIKTNQ